MTHLREVEGQIKPLLFFETRFTCLHVQKVLAQVLIADINTEGTPQLPVREKRLS